MLVPRQTLLSNMWTGDACAGSTSDACRQRAHLASWTMQMPPDMAIADQRLRRQLVHRDEIVSKRTFCFG